MRDFGSIAVAVRSGKPDPRFLQSYVGMILGGLRNGDRVLSPVIEMPHHWAACCIARDFLSDSDCDTLLMLDDDMTFEKDDLDQMRDNTTNHKYGVVQAMCCSRQPPHRPLILLESGDKYRPALPTEHTGTVSVGMVGLAFTLIRREALEAAMARCEKDELLFNWGIDGRGEDQAFCKKVRASGIRIGVDTNVTPGHRFPVEVKWNKAKGCAEYQSFKNPTFLRLLNERKGKQEE